MRPFPSYAIRTSVDEPFELKPLTEHALGLVTRGYYYACMDGKQTFLITERPEREKSDNIIEIACSVFSYIENRYLVTIPYLDKEGDLFVDVSESVDSKLIPEYVILALDDLLQDLNNTKLEQAHVKGNAKLELHCRFTRTYSTRIAPASGDEIPAFGPVGRYKTYIDFDRMDIVALFVADSYAQELDFGLESVKSKLEQLHKEVDNIKLSLWLKSHKR
ncbi:hypothetical protein WICPIJ_007531 [Wickerhamomyces pijperi]|uniref:Uncharacterized protein n=1 Tax=Wickerhamomyces pijperi TaxID=599730 RepID=A0A9P8PZR0_WICPI|nr:hypothetical protein WICPIJ_007531 [Wickerhamomyces pijperi]